MSEGINFDITAQDKTAAAVASATSNIQKLAGAGDMYANSAQEIAGMNQQFYSTQTQVNNSLLDASKAWKAQLSPLTQFRSAITTTMGLVGSVAAVGYTIKKAWDFSEQGASVIRLQTSFDSVARSYNANSTEILSSMRAASRGTIADTDLMLAANRAMLLGVSTNADELGKITEVAIARGRAMGLTSAEAIDRVYTGIGRLSPKILDDLGIITNATQRYEDYAKAHDTTASALDDFTKREIIKQAIISSSADLVKGYTADQASSYEQLTAAWTNYSNGLKMTAAGSFMGVNGGFAGLLNSAAANAQKSVSFNDYVNRFSGGMSYTKDTGYGRSYQVNLIKNQRDAAAYAERFSRTIAKGQATTAFYQQQGAATDTQNAPKGGFTQDMQMSLEGGLALTDMTAKYSAKTAELNAKLAEEQATLADLARRGYPETSDKVTEHTDKVNALRQAITNNNAAQVASQKEYALSVLKSKEASIQQQMAFAVASGQITQGAANQEAAQQKLADAFISGGISAVDYASQLATVMSKIKNMDGKRANAFIDIWIREHTIGATYGGGFFNGRDTATVKNEGKNDGTHAAARAGGGMLSGWTLVGDRPGGVLTPYSELISPWGYVYDAKMTKKLIESGAVQTMSSRAQSGEIGGYSNVSRASRMRPSAAVSKSARRGGGGAIATATVGSLDASTPVAENNNSQIAIQQMQMQQQAIQAAQANTQVLNEMLTALLELPRPIAKGVAYEVAKLKR